MGRTEWATRTEWPIPYGNKEENTCDENHEILFRHPVFREDLLLYKQKYPPAYWENLPSLVIHADSFLKELLTAWCYLCEKYEQKLGPNALTASISPVTLWADVDAYHLCRKWGLNDEDFLWIKWLATNWNPEQEAAPLSDPPVPYRPDFSPCRVITEEGAFPDSRVSRKMILELRPGVTRKGARRALEAVLNRFEEEADSSWLKGRKSSGRPRITSRQGKVLGKIFSETPIPTKRRGERTKATRQVFKQAQELNLGISESTLTREYTNWLSSQGHPAKKYKKFSDLTPDERKALVEIFSENPLSTRHRGEHAKAIAQAVKQAQKSNLGIGKATIAREYTLWLSSQGHPA